MSDNQSDLVILGGGSGGYAAALRAAELGKSVVLIEKDKVGGTCLHRGCIPTKALLHAGEIADQARESEQFGVKASFEGIDMAAVHKYKDDVISGLYKGLQGLVASRKITYVVGILVIDKKIFGALTPADQKAVSDDLGAAFARLEKINRDDNTQAKLALQKQGVEIFTPNAAETASWEAVGAEARKQLQAAGEITPEMAAALDKALAAARNK